jgi:hypothetical protein
MIKLTSKARDTVKQRMRELGRTQIDMGNMLGMTQGAFSQKLNAQYEDQGFDTEQLLKICDNLDLHYEKGSWRTGSLIFAISITSFFTFLGSH